MSDRIKYFRTPHLITSPGCINDDKQLSSEDHLHKMDSVVITEKIDGENFTGYHDGDTHARSLDSNNHASRNYAKAIWKKVSHELPTGWRICAENVYAKHSIYYKHLRSYLLVFSIWDDTNTCLDWDTTELWCELLGLRTVPVMFRGKMPSSEELIQMFDLYKSIRKDEVEGFVVRNEQGFHYNDSELNIAKYVRASHIQTSEHWLTEKIVPNELEKI